MRIRLFTAFASNNSGAYTIVGRFADEAVAAEVAALLQRAIDAHDAWHREHEWEEEGAAPLDDLVREQGLRAARHGRGDEWPSYAREPPSAVALGRQVIVHSSCTVTMPPVFGETFYARGGRVEVELDHSHEPLAAEFSWQPKGMRYDDPGKEPALDAFEALLRPELDALVARPESDRRPSVAPAWHRGYWGERHLSVVFADLVEGVRAVRAVADACGMELTLRLAECPHGVEDPLAMVRRPTIPAGLSRLILWAPGPDRVTTMKALREVMACGLDEARAAIDDLPKEVLVDVTERYAEAAAATLRASGCDAEVVAPRR
ncbi:MAG: ribosomal protein L7/L12 [Deltaproteobacteria bacterium]|nr:ribosomal protein L7/L12 [Myxococcales bacterium]MDP3213040.1 ribosomal protein L7/L12 [Deltaproteobacteria bacterium]